MEKEMITNGTESFPQEQFLTKYKAADLTIALKKIPQNVPESFVSDYQSIQDGLAAICRKNYDQITEILSPISIKSPFSQWKLLIKGMKHYYTFDNVKARTHFLNITPSLIPSKIAQSFLFLINNTDPISLTERASLNVLQNSCYLSGHSEYAETLPKAEILWLDRKYSESLQLTFNTLSGIPENGKTIEGLLSDFYFNVYFHIESKFRKRYFKALKGLHNNSPNKDLFDLRFARLEAIRVLYEETEPDEGIIFQWKLFIDKHKKLYGSNQLLEAEIYLMLGSILDKAEQQHTSGYKAGEHKSVKGSKLAENCYKISINLSGSKCAFEALLQYYRKWNRTNDYWELLKTAVTRFPADKDILYLAGKMALELNLPAIAIKYLEGAFDLDSIDTKLRQELLFAYVHASRSIPEGKSRVIKMRKTITKAINLCSLTVDDFNYGKRYFLLRKSALEFAFGDTLRGKSDLHEGFKNAPDKAKVLFFTYFIFRMYNVPSDFCNEIDSEVHNSLKSEMTETLSKVILEVLNYFSTFKEEINNFKTDVEIILKKTGKFVSPVTSCNQLFGAYLKLIIKFELYHLARIAVTKAIRIEPHNVFYKYVKLKCKITDYRSVSLANLVKASDKLNGIISDAQKSNDRETTALIREEIRNLDKYIKTRLISFFPVKQMPFNTNNNSIPFPDNFL